MARLALQTRFCQKKKRPRPCTQKNIFEILFNQAEIKLYLIRFCKDFSVCGLKLDYAGCQFDRNLNNHVINKPISSERFKFKVFIVKMNEAILNLLDLHK